MICTYCECCECMDCINKEECGECGNCDFECHHDNGCVEFLERNDYISRESVLNTIEDMDKALDTDRTVEEYKALLIECIKALPSRDSITELKKIKAEIELYSINFDDILVVNMHSVNKVIDKHISELKGEIK